jgi:hypothetical protein
VRSRERDARPAARRSALGGTRGPRGGGDGPQGNVRELELEDVGVRERDKELERLALGDERLALRRQRLARVVKERVLRTQ